MALEIILISQTDTITKFNKDLNDLILKDFIPTEFYLSNDNKLSCLLTRKKIEREAKFNA